MTDSARRLEEPQPGYVARTLLRWFMRPARVVAVAAISEHFRLIDLEGDALKNIAWTVGQKMQISMGTGLTARTYTPMSWDPEHGRTRLLAFMHGDAPGSRWAEGLREGDMCQFLGPRRSLDLSGIEAPLVLFGDETSFALAAALSTVRTPRPTFIFEVTDIAQSRSVLEGIGLGDASMFARATDDAHLGAAAGAVAAYASASAHFVLTGRAPAIQQVNRGLRATGVGSSRMKTKAYWAPGKTGLD